MDGKLSRREFIRTAGLMGTGLTLAACTPVAPQVSTGDDRQAAMEPVVAISSTTTQWQLQLLTTIVRKACLHAAKYW